MSQRFASVLGVINRGGPGGTAVAHFLEPMHDGELIADGDPAPEAPFAVLLAPFINYNLLPSSSFCVLWHVINRMMTKRQTQGKGEEMSLTFPIPRPTTHPIQGSK